MVVVCPPASTLPEKNEADALPGRLAVCGRSTGAKTVELKATPDTAAWGHHEAIAKPVLTVQSGDTVRIHTLVTNSPTGLEQAGVAPVDAEQSLREVYDKVPASAGGPGAIS